MWRLEDKHFQKMIPSQGMHFLLWFIEAQIWQFCLPPSIRLCGVHECRWRQKSDSCKFSFLSGLFSHLLHVFFSKNSVVCQFIVLWKPMLKYGVREEICLHTDTTFILVWFSCLTIWLKKRFLLHFLRGWVWWFQTVLRMSWQSMPAHLDLETSVYPLEDSDGTGCQLFFESCHVWFKGVKSLSKWDGKV